MNITPDEAVQALKEIEDSRLAMRSAIKNHRGHLYLWLWGLAWIVVSILNWRSGREALGQMLWVWGVASAITVAIGLFQNNRIRSRFDKRFLVVSGATLVFGYCVWPVFFGGFHDYKGAYGYYTCLWMQIYVIAGIWFENIFIWIGIAVTALFLGAFLFVPTLFWGASLLCGVALLVSGFYVRKIWS
jgi:hypothetical protein